MIPVQTTYLRPRMFPIYLMLGITLSFFIVYYYNRTNDIMLYAGGMAVLFVGIYWFALSKAYVVIDNDGITTNTVFKRETINWKEIRKVYIKIRHAGKNTQYIWYLEDNMGKDVNFSSRLY